MLVEKDIIVDYNLSDGFEVLAKNVTTAGSTFSQAKLDVLNPLNLRLVRHFKRWRDGYSMVNMMLG